MPTALSVNLNKIALLRNSREGNSPDVCEFARMAIDAGAQGLTVHPRPDQRHIRPNDVYQLAELVTHYKNIEFNIEGNPFEPASNDYPGFMALVDAVKPDQATLVPDASEQLTSDHGFNLSNDGEQLTPVIEQLQSQGVRISLFMDPDPEQIHHAKHLGADRIELYTGPYAEAHANDDYHISLTSYRTAAITAHELGLKVNAGHDLNLKNLPDFLSIAGIAEVSIGHALTIDALLMGYTQTISAYSKICNMS